jgi:hypothetical protein
MTHFLFCLGEELPEVRTEQSEFVRLVYYLELVTEGMDWNRFNAAVALNWPTAEAASSPVASTSASCIVETQAPELVVSINLKFNRYKNAVLYLMKK